MGEHLEIRNYEARDHEDVCGIFKEGIHEIWWPAYRLNLNHRHFWIWGGTNYEIFGKIIFQPTVTRFTKSFVFIRFKPEQCFC